MKPADPRPAGTMADHDPVAQRSALVLAGFLLVLIQGHTAARAADLPQALTGVGARFQGAAAPVVTGNQMVINQFADKATLHWQSFDIGANHSVEFRQPSSSSVALNRIFDAAPSQIEGRLTANGQVYLINSNGIVFGDGAQVNTQSRVASTLDIDDQVYEQIGFVNAINDPSGALPAFDSMGRPMGEIRLEAGATLDAAPGGRILIFAPRITNEGTIRTPEGQQVLAAVQDRVLIAASEDPNLRGLLVEVSTGGDVSNLGTLIAERGNISLVGMAVNQEGIARATTSVSLNGSVRLRAQDMNGTLALGNDLVPRRPKPVRGGDLHLGGTSVTEVVPDGAVDAEGAELRAVDAQVQPLSVVELAGTRVHIDGGARVTSTGGAINVTAAANPGQANLAQPGDPATIAAGLVIESGALVDASGDDTTQVSVARNVVEVEARGNELADSPEQREGPIRNEKLKVDLRRGTEFLKIDGAVAAIGRTAAERQAAGGSIIIRSEGRVVLEEGARLDVSGGTVTYTGDFIATSRLRQANGKVVEISGADPGEAYLGLADDLITRESGYIEGKDAGSLTLQARGFELSGALQAGSTAGANQRRASATLAAGVPAFARPWDQAPLGGALALTLLGPRLQGLVIGAPPAVGPGDVTPLVLGTDWLQASGATRIGLGNAGPIIFDGALELPAWSTFTASGTQVSLSGWLRSAGGQVGLIAQNDVVGAALVPDEALRVDIDGTIDLAGSWVNDNPLLLRARPSALIVLDGGRLVVDSGSALTVSAASRLDVSAGAWRTAGGDLRGGDGGRIELRTGEVTTNAAFGSPLDLAGELRGFGFGQGGALEIATERIRIVPQTGPDAAGFALDTSRRFGLDELTDGLGNRQYVLEIDAAAFREGGFQSFSLASSRNDLEVVADATVRLQAANLQFTGNAAALAPTGTALATLAAPALLPDFQRRPMTLALEAAEELSNPIGPVAGLSLAAGAAILADAGSTISLQGSTGIRLDGRIDAPAGRIDVAIGGSPGVFDPRQMIWLGPAAWLSADGTALIDTLDPRGVRRGQVLDAGRIRIRANQGSIVGSAGALLSVDGRAAELDAGLGLPVRTTVAGNAGAIELTAAESLLWQGALRGAAPDGFTTRGGQLTVGIDPGRRGAAALVGPDGIPRGPHRLVMQDFAGPLPAAGAAIDPVYFSTGFVPVTQVEAGGFSSLDLVVRSSATGTDEFGIPVPDTPQSLPIIEFPVDLELNLGRSIRIDAAVLSTESALVSLSAPYLGVGYGDSRVRLDGAVPDKSSATNPGDTTLPIRLTPIPGEGTLRLEGSLVEFVGEAVTWGFGNATAGREGVVVDAYDVPYDDGADNVGFVPGDVRLRGVRKIQSTDFSGLFRTAGNLRIDAARIYPATLTAFELGVEGSGGRMVLGGGSAVTPAPLSAGGALRLHASEIVQGGALFAPLGALDLQADVRLRFTAGSLTSTSAVGLQVPFFRTEPGGALILPAPSLSEDQIVFVPEVRNPEFERQLPAKRIDLDAPAIELQPGSSFDLRGGGSVAASEFVPGPGGSRDILLADLDRGGGVEVNRSFAILPGVDGFSPFDPLETPDASAVQGLGIGDTLVLEDGLAGLPAGEYAMLPARYALFGGFLVTPAGYQDLAAGAGLQRLDGAPILAGRYGVAGSAAADVRSQGFAIEDGSRVRRRAEYLLTPLDTLYGDTRAPRDAGALVVRSGDQLQLQGTLVRDAAGAVPGRGSAVDIATTAALAVVDSLTGAAGIELLAADLARLGADSLLLGGVRSEAEGELGIDALSSEVRVSDGVELELAELLLVGDRVVVEAAAGAATRLVSSAPARDEEVRLRLDGAAALLALSDRRLLVGRDSGGLDGSSLDIASDVTLGAAGGLALDATGEVMLGGGIERGEAALLSLGAGRIALGETDGEDIGAGLVLSNERLALLAGGDLRLRSRALIDIYGELADPADPADATPIAFGALGIDAPGLRGRANAGRRSVLAADVIELANGGAAASAGAAAAWGSELQLAATREIRLGNGTFALQGYADASLESGTALLLAGDSALNAAGGLAIDTPLIGATGAFGATVTAADALVVRGGREDFSRPTAPGLGAGLSFSAAAVNFDGRIVLPSGSVRITGGQVVVGDSASIDVSGESFVFGPRQVGTPGGEIALEAGAGDLLLASGARFDVSGAGTDGEAGRLQIGVSSGSLDLGAGVQLAGHGAAGRGGRFELDAVSLADSAAPAANALTLLTGLLGSGGFDTSVDLRLRNQDIDIVAGSSITARHIGLSADAGRITIAGDLVADGTEAGDIRLAAGDGLEVAGRLSARSTLAGGVGGRIDLLALDADGDDPAGSTDTVQLLSGSRLDVSGGAEGRGGEVFVHTRRLDSQADGQTDRLLMGAAEGAIIGAARADLVATRVLRNTGAAGPNPQVTLRASTLEAWRSETESFLGNLPAAAVGPLHVVAGLQVESSGDLVLADRWNFVDGWYFGRDLGDPANPVPGTTGMVTLRAAGNIELRADMSDAFTEQLLFGFQPVTLLNGGLGGAVVPQAWGYRLAAGADLGSADVLATGGVSRSLSLGDGVRLRTGTANIDLAASGDVHLGDGAAIYAAGWDKGLSDPLRQVMAPVVEPFGLTAYDFFGAFLNGGQFPVAGGAVHITAGGSLVAAAPADVVTSWLTRIGSGVISSINLYSSTEGYGAVPTHWGVALEQFRNGVGAFGGGHLHLTLGGDIVDAVLAVPGSGRVGEGVVADTSTGALLFQPGVRQTEVLPGGNLEIRTGGTLDGGQVVVDGGTARLRTSGTTGEAPLLYVGGSADVDWLATRSLTLAGLQDPTTVALSESQMSILQLLGNYPTTASIDNRFYTYAPGARVRLAVLGGDVTFDGPGYGGFLPPSLAAIAFGGNVNVVAPAVEFYPSPLGQLELLARDNVVGNFAGSVETRLRQSDQDPATLPSVDRPDILAGAPIPARVPLHLGDEVPNLLVALDGSIRSDIGKAGFWTLEFAKPVVMQAGLDLGNLSVRTQHIDTHALSSFVAGRDIVQGELRDNTGRFATNDRRIFEIWGPGSAEFVAARDISLGTSAGIESIGNAKNPALAAEGSALRLLAGTGGEPAYERFIDVYLSAEPSADRDSLNAFLARVDAGRAGFETSSDKSGLAIAPGEYAGALGKFLERRAIALIDGDPLRTFRALDRARQREFITEVVFSELKDWGAAAETPDRADRLNYLRGYTALDTLFEIDQPLTERASAFAPGVVESLVQDYLSVADPQAANASQVSLFGTFFPQPAPRGQVSLLLSQVQTLAGGSLAILAPSGDINAGAADADVIDKASSDLGIVTARGGNLDIQVGNDLLVNSTRVFALQGDLLVWSSHGNIDAGKGAKTVTSVPDPITRIDPNTGNTIIEFPPAVSGSGLQGENAALFAPRGAVNAGDAGIRTSGDLTIGAVEVVGADNIDVGGVEIGFSTADVAAVAPPGASSASSAATKGVESQAALSDDDGDSGERIIEGTQVTFITVDVLSFGDGCEAGEEDCERD
jgi:filamentous hemagglutinin family protein